MNMNGNENVNGLAPNNLFTASPNINAAINSSAYANNGAINNTMNINPNINNRVVLGTPSAQEKPKVIKKIKGKSPTSLISNSPNMNES